ncbi:744_t:CDS:2 [Gigaspora rosea]|nr:744_t:CDS:2 [Gigaspora rosea]
MSEQSSLATSTNEEKSVPISVEVVRKYNTEQLIQFLHEKEDLQLNDTHFEILRNEEITGPAFLSTTEQMLRSYGMKGGPALVLAEFAQKIKQTTVTFSRQVSNVRDMLSNMRTEETFSSYEQEILSLRTEVASLKTLLNKSNHEFTVIVKPKTVSGFKWVADIDKVTLDNLKNEIKDRKLSPVLEDNHFAILEFSYENESEKFIPKDDREFCNLLRIFISEKKFRLYISISSPSRPFASWTLPEVCQLYGLCDSEDDSSLDVFPIFSCGCKDLNDETSQEVLKQLISELKFRVKSSSIHSNEASKSHYVKKITGPNGHGPVNFSIDLAKSSKTACVTEVKYKDFEKGVAQNAVQIESVLTNRKRKAEAMKEAFVNKIFGIITDAKEWRFLECTYDDDGKHNFKLSKSIYVDYEEDIETKVKKVLGHIAWVLEEVKKPAEGKSKEQQGSKRQKNLE